MTTMGVPAYNCNRVDTSGSGGEREQLMLLRTLHDNERNIIGNRNSTIIAPKTNQTQRRNNQTNNSLPPYDTSRLKKHGKNGQPPPVAVARRNARERNRVKQVNNGFATLRSHIPSHVAQGYGDRGKKLSKVETLRMAVEYIKGLQKLLAEADGICDYDATISTSSNNNGQILETSIPSPADSSYNSIGTPRQNNSDNVMCLTSVTAAGGGELEEQQSIQGEINNIIDEDDGDSYLMEEEEDDDERDRRAKRFRDNSRTHNSSERNLLVTSSSPSSTSSAASRRRRNSPTINYYSQQQHYSSFGDEENIEPLPTNANNNNVNATNNNNNNILNSSSHYSPVLANAQQSPPLIKRETCTTLDDELNHCSPGAVEVNLNSPNHYELGSEANQEATIIINPKLEIMQDSVDDVGLVVEADGTTHQFVYLTSSEPLSNNSQIFYKHEISEGTEFMEYVSWFEQEQGRLSSHLGQTHAQRMAHV